MVSASYGPRAYRPRSLALIFIAGAVLGAEIGALLVLACLRVG
jgi:hypothetical protein